MNIFQLIHRISVILIFFVCIHASAATTIFNIAGITSIFGFTLEEKTFTRDDVVNTLGQGRWSSHGVDGTHYQALCYQLQSEKPSNLNKPTHVQFLFNSKSALLNGYVFSSDSDVKNCPLLAKSVSSLPSATVDLFIAGQQEFAQRFPPFSSSDLPRGWRALTSRTEFKKTYCKYANGFSPYISAEIGDSKGCYRTDVEVVLTGEFLKQKTKRLTVWRNETY